MVLDIDREVYDALIGTFADDTRLWRFITSPQDELLVQHELDTIYNWAEVNNMTFNSAKFEGMRFGGTTDLPSYRTGTGSFITTHEHVMDLGILISHNLKFDCHIRNVVSKGLKLAGWALRTFRTRNTVTMLTLLKSIVVSQVEYGCPVWSPTDMHNINLLETVQRTFTARFAVFRTYDPGLQMAICTVPYHERLRRLHLYSLQRRRERYLICYVYKIVIHLVPNPGLTWDYTRNNIVVSPRYPKQRVNARRVSASLQTLRRNSFFVQGPLLYNKIPKALRELEDIRTPGKEQTKAFKIRLDQFLSTIPDIPGTQWNTLLHWIPSPTL